MSSRQSDTIIEDTPFSIGPHEEDDVWGNQYLADEVILNSEEGNFDHYAVPKLGINVGEADILVKFGHPPTEVKSHKLEFANREYPGYYACLGDDCPACAAGFKTVTRCIDYFYSPSREMVVCHAHNKDRKAQSFGSRLLRSCRGGYPAVLLLTRTDAYNHGIKRIEGEPDLDLGVRAIKAFLADLEAGNIDTADIIEEISADEMASAERVKTILALRGRK